MIIANCLNFFDTIIVLDITRIRLKNVLSNNECEAALLIKNTGNINVGRSMVPPCLGNHRRERRVNKIKFSP